MTPVLGESHLTNIYHCCVYKTGSQWIRRIFSDPRLYMWSGLKPLNGASLGGGERNRIPVSERIKPEGFPAKTAVLGMFISYENFKEIKKPDNHITFFIMRDPRELVISWYFSTRYTHVKNPSIMSLREKMEGMTDKEGIMFSIDYWKHTNHFNMLSEWNRAEQNYKKLKIFSFEDLTGANAYFHFKQIISYCGIKMPEKILKQVYESHSIQKISSAKNENKYSYSLKNSNMKWPKYFDDNVQDYFLNAAPGLVEKLGYEW